MDKPERHAARLVAALLKSRPGRDLADHLCVVPGRVDERHRGALADSELLRSRSATEAIHHLRRHYWHCGWMSERLAQGGLDPCARCVDGVRQPLADRIHLFSESIDKHDRCLPGCLRAPESYGDFAAARWRA